MRAGKCCFDVESPSKKLLYQLIGMSVVMHSANAHSPWPETIRVEPLWIELPFCQECRCKFSVTTRKHHWFVLSHDVT